MSAFYREKVLSVQHWTDTLFSFRATRDSGFRFQNGQFAMIGLEVEGRPLLRAYSMASANHEEELEFFSIKVQDGPLTSKLQKIREGDTILVGRKATGTLITDNLIPGKRLLLLSTGTGLAPFASLIKDPEIYEKFETIILVHGCRQVSELAYGEELLRAFERYDLVGEFLREVVEELLCFSARRPAHDVTHGINWQLPAILAGMLSYVCKHAWCLIKFRHRREQCVCGLRREISALG